MNTKTFPGLPGKVFIYMYIIVVNKLKKQEYIKNLPKRIMYKKFITV